MIDYKEMWEQAVEQNKLICEQNERIKLRDQFAMAALPAIMNEQQLSWINAAEHAYAIADLMMEVRDRNDVIHTE